MKYARFGTFKDQEGVLVALYDSDFNTNIPAEAIRITEEQYLDLVENQSFRRLVNGVIVEWTPPPPPPPPLPPISDRQFFQALAMMGEITEQEALAAVQTGTLPKIFEEMLSHKPESEQFAARMLLSGATEFDRYHPLVATVAEAMGWSDDQVDDLWHKAAEL